MTEARPSLPPYERALFADLDTLLDRLPRGRCAVQWDVAVEFGLLEGAMGLGSATPIDHITPALVRCVDRVPADVPVGLHLCYGDYGHQHFKQPDSVQLQVDLVNAVAAGAQRPVNWASFTVPQARNDGGYFAPLRDLTAGQETELYFALVPYHPDDQHYGTAADPGSAHRRRAWAVGSRADNANGVSAPNAGWDAWNAMTCRSCSTCTVRSSQSERRSAAKPVNLDLFRLLVFVTVVDRGGYSAAARPAEPDPVRRFRIMSASWNGPAWREELVRYRDRSVHVTDAGQEVYRAALSMLAEQDHLTASLADLKEGRRGRVRLGASMAFEQKYFFGEVIAPFCRAHRGTLLSLRFGHSRREAQAVLDRDLDLAYVIRWHLPPGARFEPLHEIELTFLASRRHPLAGGQPVTKSMSIGAGKA